MAILSDTQKETAAAGAAGVGEGTVKALQTAALVSKVAPAGSALATGGLGTALTGALATGPAAPIALAAVALAFGARAIKRKRDADKAALAAEKLTANRAKDSAKNAREAQASAQKAARTGGVVAGFEQELGEAALFRGGETNYDSWKRS